MMNTNGNEQRHDRSLALGSMMLLLLVSFLESRRAHTRIMSYMMDHSVVSNPPHPPTPTPAFGGGDGPMIPSRLHLIHLSKGLPVAESEQAPPPEAVQKNVEAWKALHPSWTVTLWDNALARREFPELIPALEQLDVMSQISDILRYHIVERFGGVYVDTDIIPFRSLDDLRPLQNFTVCERPRDSVIDLQGLPVQQSLPNLLQPSSSCDLACTAVIASTPHNPALLRAAQTSYERTVRKIPLHLLYLTGPYMWTDKVKEFNLNILKTNTFYPCGPKNKSQCIRSNFENIPHVFAMHTWSYSWGEQLAAAGNNSTQEQAAQS